MKRLFLTIILSLSVFSARADWADDFRYSYYTISEGLCDDYATSTYMDSDGYLWICTSNGLDRFDGYRFDHYNSQSPIASRRINNNFIYGVAEDGANGIWAASNTGIVRIDKNNDVVIMPEQMGQFRRYVSAPMVGIMRQSDNLIWALKSNEIDGLDIADDGTLVNVRPYKTSNPGQRIMTLVDRTIFIGGLYGIEGFHISPSGELSPVEDAVIRPIADIRDVSYLIGNGNYLWIGTENGLYQYNIKTKEIQKFLHENGNDQSISDNHVTCLAYDKSGDLLIGTTKGIDLYALNGKFSHMSQKRRYHSLNTNYVNNIMVDEYGTMWVSTLVGGVNRISPETVHHQDLFVVEEGTTNIVSCSMKDRNGNILAGILGKGLGIKYASDGSERIFSLKENAGVTQEDVFAMVQDKHGDFWICTRFDGMIFLDGKDLKHPSFKIYSTRNSHIGSDHIYTVIYDEKRDGLWYSTVEGVWFFDIASKESKHITLNTSIEQPSRFFCLLLDKYDKLWMGGYGLCTFSLAGEEVKDSYYASYMPYINQQSGDNLERINSIAQAADGTIFLGSNNNGIYELQDDGSFKNRPLSNSQVFEYTSPVRVSKLVADSSDNIWIGTASGVFHLNRDTDIITHFGISDGFPSNNCYTNSGNNFSDNVVAFGTSNGLIMISAPMSSIESNGGKVRITRTLKGEQDNLWPKGDRIDVYPGETYFDVYFSSLDLTNPERIWYAYRLDETGKEFTYTRNGFIRFNNVKTGKYTLRVRCTTPEDQWVMNDTLFSINIHPKFTQTALFWILILGTILGLLAAVVITNIRNRILKNRELQQQVNEKTADLTTAMENLIESKDSIERQNVLLEEQKAKLEEYAASMEKANREKLMLYTNLTHEFKTPLSLILGPVSDLKESCKDEEVKPSLGIIERNSKYLLSLVNQILDLRKVDSGQISVKKDSLHIPSFLSIFSMDFNRSFSQRNVQFETNLRLMSNTIISDRDILFKIISNLISNAMKYTPDGGKVTFNLTQFRRRSDRRIFQYISVTNTGSYIGEEEAGKIFDLFYKSKTRPVYGDGSQSSTGIGLYLVKNLVSALGGQITVKSTEKGGTSFRVYFPVDLVTDDSMNTFVEGEEMDNVPVLLLVEDNDDMRNYIKSVLADRFKVLEAANGEKGYEIAKQTIPDFIISDLMMPVCDGIQFCRMVRADSLLSHIPFLMLTALSDDDTRLNSYKEGVNAFLVKPFKKDMLLARIENILNDRQQVQEELSYDLENSYATVNIDRSDKAFMEQLMNVLKDNYTDPEFSVPKLQSLLCMSMTPFYKKVSSLTGLTPAMLIRRYRLQTAKTLLETNRDKGVNVSEIAYMVGFNDPKYFSKCFQKEYHIKPSSLLQGGDPDDKD